MNKKSPGTRRELVETTGLEAVPLFVVDIIYADRCTICQYLDK